MFNRDLLILSKSTTSTSWYNMNNIFLEPCWSKQLLLFKPKRLGLFILPEKLKVDVTGKVFKWNGSPKIWQFLVHYSHITNLLFNYRIFFFKKSGKNRYTIFSKKRVYFFHLKRFLSQIRYSDLFTNRGTKYTPRKFFKKQGKISTYI